jgi:hypothetical protein
MLLQIVTTNPAETVTLSLFDVVTALLAARERGSTFVLLADVERTVT